MPHKFYANCRDNLPKQKHRVKNGLSTKKAYGGAGDLVIPPFLTGCIRRTYAAFFSFWVGVMPPMPMFGRSLL
jgi:hypothetical protein